MENQTQPTETIAESQEALSSANSATRRVPWPALKEGGAFDQQMTVALRERIEALMTQLIPPENTESYTHGEGFVFQRVDSSIGSGKFQQKFVGQEMKTESIVSNDLQALLAFMEGLAQRFHKQMKQFLLQRVGEEAASVGNVASYKAGMDLAAVHLEMLKMVEFGVDRHGNMSFPDYRVNPETGARIQAAIQAQGPEYHKQIAELIREKTADATRREHERLAKYTTVEEAK